MIAPGPGFWASVARDLVGRYPGGFTRLQVLVPAFSHAALLRHALAAELGHVFIAPRINTVSGWLAQHALMQEAAPPSDSARLMSLYAELRQHGWLKKLFAARSNTDLLPLAEMLLTLSDELTKSLLPQTLRSSESVAERWNQALGQLPAPARKLLSDESQLVWSIWQGQLEHNDKTALRYTQLLALAEAAGDALAWISPVAPDEMEQAFLQTYAEHAPVHQYVYDWRAGALLSLYALAWREMPEADEFAEQGEIATPPGVALLPCKSLEHEAQCAAQTVLDWLIAGKRSVAIVAQDRVVARRIRALLDRAQVRVMDETGWKLSTTRAAASVVAWLDIVATRADTATLLDFLKSPYVCAKLSGKTRQVMAFEMALRRANIMGGWRQVLAASAQAQHRHDQGRAQAPAAPPEAARVFDTAPDAPAPFELHDVPGLEGVPLELEDYTFDLEQFAGITEDDMARLDAGAGLEDDAPEALATAAQPVPVPAGELTVFGLVAQIAAQALHFTGAKTIAAWTALMQETLDLFGMHRALDDDEAGRQVLAVLENLGGGFDAGTLFSFNEYRACISAQFEATAFIAPGADPRVVMLPLNGARLRTFDAVLVAGCDARHLPSLPPETLFFANAVRRELGLPTRESRQRQQLRDFAEVLLTNPMVVLSWQDHQVGEPNPCCPWIERLSLALARAGQPPLPLHRVAIAPKTLYGEMQVMPAPDAAPLTPSRLSASGYNSFIACPYQFFASRMLHLAGLDDFSDMPEKRDYGGWLHDILKQFHDAVLLDPGQDRPALLNAISEKVFEVELARSAA
ncbi:MAG TPA: PD-(D/E)XK nuclease family protein, partial [Burkholderiaceae bacterium]